MSLLDKGGDIFRWAMGAVVPMFVRPGSPKGLAWFVHLVLLTALAVGLYFAQPHLGVTVNVGRGPGWFRPYWLPVLFLLAYALLWAVAWLWLALAPNQPTTDFPDLDAAWDEIVASLEKAGIGLADTPLFLVFGSQPAGFEPLFRALPHGLTVTGGTSAGSPLKVFANREGIYLAVPGASLLGIQELGGVSSEDFGGGGGAEFLQSIGAGQSIGLGASIGMSAAAGSVGPGSVGGGGGPLQEIQRIIRRARDENRPLTDAEKLRVRDLSGGGGGGAPAPKPTPAGSSAKSGASILQNPQVAGEAAARLGHVCHRIAATRWPLCPINGALLAVPMSEADKDESAQQWGLVAREDLAVAEASLKLQFPVYAVVGGAEDLPGGQLFFERFAADKGNQRLGKGFPLNPELKPADAPEAVEKAVAWIFGNLLPYWSLRLTKIDPAGTGPETRDNAHLVRFLAEVSRRGAHLARLLSRAVVPGDRAPTFGGCYLSVVSQASPDEAKFAKEFFRKVESTQGYVAWTDEAFAEDAGYRSTTKLGYLALMAILIAVLGFAGYVAATKWMK